MRILLAAALIAGVAVPAQAVTISGLYNTGVDASGNKLADNDAAEIHYLVNGSATAVTYTHPAYLVASDGVFISASSGGGYSVNPNNYTLTFDLTGLQAKTATISGNFAADNYASVYLNGTLIAAQPAATIFENFQQLTSFSANSGFLAGINTLRFEVTDTGPPSALLVSGITGSALAVPEPAEWALLIGGFAFAGLAARRRRQSIRVTYA
jgi:hypothetical protein